MNYLSVCSGIEAASAAWHNLGWTPVAFSEIEKFPSAVLAHHFPQVPNLGDMTKFHEWPDTYIDLLVGGCPCQAFSVAGLREGLNDPRGNLTLTFLGVAAKYKPRWIVYENVPGILSDKTDAFGCLVAGLVELGYGVAWRLHDAQYAGLAQRRKRVFVVAYLGDWGRASEVLFEPDCLRWNPPPSREARQEVTGTLSARTEGGGGLGTDFDLGGGLVAADIAPTLNAHFGEKQGLENQHIDSGGGYLSRAIAGSLCSRDNKSARMDADTNHLIPTHQGGFFDGPTHSLRAEGFDASEDGTGRGTPLVTIPILEAGARTGKSTTDIRAGSGIGDDGDPMFTLQRGKQHAVAFNWNAQVDQMNFNPDTTPSLTCSQGAAVGPLLNMAVRRLTPVECERLMGFPDHWTNIPWRGKLTSPDGPRYKALGNSMAVPCMAWIGRRIAAVDARRTPTINLD